MKKINKFLLVLAGICAAVGVALCLCAAILGASLFDMFKNNEFSFYIDRRGLHAGWEAPSAPDAPGAAAVDEGFINETFDASSVKRLVIDVDICQVNLYGSGDMAGENKIEITSAAAYKMYKTELNGSTLTIKDSEDVISLFGYDNDRTVDIYVPEDLVFETMEINVDAGSFWADHCRVSGLLKIEVEAGGAEISEMSARHLEAEVEAGGLSIYSGELLGDADLSVEAGSMDIALTGSRQDFNYRIKSSLGSVFVNNDEWSGLEKETSINNSADKTISINCEVGSLTLYTE